MRILLKKKFFLLVFCSIILFSIVYFYIKEEELIKESEETAITTVLTKLCEIPNKEIQDICIDSKNQLEKEISETKELGVYSVLDSDKLWTELYGSYFTEEGIESIPFWITSLHLYSCDHDIQMNIEDIKISSKESSEDSYYLFDASVKYIIHEKEQETKMTGTVLFEDKKIKNIYFDDKWWAEMEAELL